MFLISVAGTFVFLKTKPIVNILYFPSSDLGLHHFEGRYGDDTLDAIKESAIIEVSDDN